MWYIGVALEIVSTMSGTIGKQLIRLSEVRKTKNPGFSNMAYWAGIVINTAVGPIIDMAAYSFAPQSLIAPFGGLDVVWNAMLAPYLLNEKLTKRRIAGSVLIVLGTILAGCMGNHKDSEYTLEYLEDTLINFRVLIYFLAFSVWFLLNRCFLMRRPVGSAIRGVSLGCTAGTIAGNMFCVKAVVELVQTSIRDQDSEVWLHWLPYAMLAGAIFFALSNVVYMTRGLKEYEALFMVTIYEGSMIVANCLSGAIVLQDLRTLEAWRVSLYSLSILIICLGMYVIFSQEAMNKSSLYAGTASIEVPGSTNEARRSVQLQAAVAVAPLARQESGGFAGTPKGRSRSDSFPEATTLGNGATAQDGFFMEADDLIKDVEAGSQSQRPLKAEFATVHEAVPAGDEASAAQEAVRRPRGPAPSIDEAQTDYSKSVCCWAPCAATVWPSADGSIQQLRSEHKLPVCNQHAVSDAQPAGDDCK